MGELVEGIFAVAWGALILGPSTLYSAEHGTLYALLAWVPEWFLGALILSNGVALICASIRGRFASRILSLGVHTFILSGVVNAFVRVRPLPNDLPAYATLLLFAILLLALELRARAISARIQKPA